MKWWNGIKIIYLATFESFELFFRYNQLSYKDNTVDHCFEVGNFALKNLLPDEIYREALMPHEIDLRRRLDKMVMLRIYCRISPAVAGIMVKDHFEVNVCPIKVQISHKLFHQMESFFFPKNIATGNADQLEFRNGMMGEYNDVLLINH